MLGFSVIGDELWFNGYCVGVLGDYGAPPSVQDEARQYLHGRFNDNYRPPTKEIHTGTKIAKVKRK